jgi:hypothetical protein
LISDMMKIAILYICTGKYSIFWDNFFKSSEQFLLLDHEKHYFVFTDSSEIITAGRIHTIFQSKRGFPLDSLLRFEMFMTISDKLKLFDYIYFFNSNIQFVSPVGDEILPDESHGGIVGFLHPGYFNKRVFWFPYERRKKSSAYISPDTEKLRYYMGAANGGRSKDYMNLIETCFKNTQNDLKKGITAIYHDESHLNKYLAGKQILQLSPAYLYPEDSKLDFDPKILIVNKVKHGGKFFDKLPKTAYYRRADLFAKRFFGGIFWYLGR